MQARARSAALKAAASRVATASAVLFGVGAIGLGAVLVFTDLLPFSGAGTGVGAGAGTVGAAVLFVGSGQLMAVKGRIFTVLFGFHSGCTPYMGA